MLEWLDLYSGQSVGHSTEEFGFRKGQEIFRFQKSLGTNIFIYGAYYSPFRRGQGKLDVKLTSHIICC